MIRRSIALLLVLAPGTAMGTGFTDHGEDIRRATETSFALEGALRLRAQSLTNLDLDRGPTPSGELFYPVSLSDPAAQTLYATDLRLRTDLAFYAPGNTVAVKLRVDILDNVAIAGSADGIPGGSTTQRPPSSVFRIKRAYGEVVTPLGYLAAGRIGNHVGLGMLGNGGDCAECDSGDAADRIAVVLPTLGHLIAVAYDFTAAGNLARRDGGNRAIDVEPTAQVRTISAALIRHWSEAAHRRRLRADKSSLEYGAYFAYRFQQNDIPANYLPLAVPTNVDAAQIVYRGFDGIAADLWFRFIHPFFRIEAEAAYLWSRVDQPSVFPGVLLANDLEARQFGFALESEVGGVASWIHGGLNLGFASGDDAPGFGARTSLTRTSVPQSEDLDGPQGGFAGDNRVDNFRFHPDYRVDRILFREIIGTVTGAYYFRPHLRLRLIDFGRARLQFSTAGIVSFAHKASSSPGGQAPLGVELDSSLGYQSDDGFDVMLQYAVLFPLSGLDNVEAGLSARPAQILHLRAAFGF